MFDINAPEFVVLVVIAIVLFGPEKLPEFARKAARVLRYVRDIAGNAQEQLSQELGPEFKDLDIRDLNPKTFVQKHLMDDIEPVVGRRQEASSATHRPSVKARGTTWPARSGRSRSRSGGPTAQPAGSAPRVAGAHAPFDPEAT